MGEMITKPDTNPILIAVLNLFLFNCVGYFMMGQQKKAIISLVLTFFVIPIIATITCGFGGVVYPIWVLITTYDSYLVAQKLASGESVGMNENGLDFLNAIFKD